MQSFSSCTASVAHCMDTRRFAISHLTSAEATMKLHIHSCHEIYYSVAGGKRFFINDNYYDMHAGDLFFIGCNENHHVAAFDNTSHERINLAVHPDFLQRFSTCETNLNACFTIRQNANHRVHLDAQQQKRFAYLIHKIGSAEGFGADIMENALMCELMVLLNCEFMRQNRFQVDLPGGAALSPLVLDVINYINSNIPSDLSVKHLAGQFFVSESYLCRVFKAHTGITVNKYVSARRISIAKSLLDAGVGAGDAAGRTGFSNYTTFFKTFTAAVGVSPQTYLKYK